MFEAKMDEVLPDGWSGNGISITCPHGVTREQDGSFDNAECDCTNPMKALGMI